MVRSSLEQYTIADFIDWHRSGRLVLNPDFQRRSVWTTAAKTYLIDTILRGMSIPKMYFRNKIDVETNVVVRDVVDGQQRLRALFEFVDNAWALGSRAKEFRGLTYDRLDDELKTAFLTYPVAVEQLVDATNTEILDLFARLNSYNVRLNPAELRHAEFQGEFKWEVREAAQRWAVLWEDFGIVAPRDRLRMADDSLMAEMFGVLLKGITDGGAPRVRRLYLDFDAQVPRRQDVTRRLDGTLRKITQDLAGAIDGPLARAPHFLMLFAAVAHAKYGIPSGEIASMPERPRRVLSDPEAAIRNLGQLAEVIEGDEPARRLRSFYRASHSSTQRIASRRERFPIYFDALSPAAVE